MTVQSSAPVRRAHIVALMVTRRCNMTCAHCSVESSPNIKDEPSLSELLARVSAIAESGAHLMLLTGGEPMLRQKEVFAILRHARKIGLHVTMATNGFWGSTREQAERMVHRLRRAGLITLTISPDRYHAPFQAIDVSLNIARAAHSNRVPLNVNLTRTGGDDPDLNATVNALEKDTVVQNHVSVRFFDVQPVGRARNLRHLRGENGGACIACGLPAVTDDGRVTACNGPSYFAPEGSPLSLGSLKTHSFAELLDKHASDPILDTIRLFGVNRLADELRQISGFEHFPFRSSYSGMCELCTQITSSDSAVAALRARLSGEALTAERQARRMIVAGQRRQAPLHYVSVNSTERARVLWPALRGQPWPSDADQILGRADFDWKRAVEYFAGCGLARQLVPRLNDREISRWAPRFFAERVRTHALTDTLRDFVIRDVLDALDEALDAVGVDGVLLKSSAMQARAPRGAAVRAGHDIDILVPAAAVRLRERLLVSGWEGGANDRRTAAHHLAPVRLRGVLVEIHTHLLPAMFGLPENEMLVQRRLLAGHRRLFTLDPAGELLHAVVHGTSHLFTYGLKTAWDAAEIVDAGGLDWDRLADWVERMAIPRSFWVLLNAVHRDLRPAIPPSFLRRSPHDLKQLRLEAIARRRAFSAIDAAEELNPFSKNAVFLMMCDSPAARARVLWGLMERDATVARKVNWEWMARHTSRSVQHQLRRQLTESWQQWRDYRRITRSDQFRRRAEQLLSRGTHGHA